MAKVILIDGDRTFEMEGEAVLAFVTNPAVQGGGWQNTECNDSDGRVRQYREDHENSEQLHGFTALADGH